MPEDLGSINVSVESEGVEDAADDISGLGDEMSGVGTGGGGGGGRAALKGGIGGYLLGKLDSVVGILDPILTIMNAILAPVGLLLLRLMQPVLRWFVKLLPKWYSFINDVSPYLAVLAIVPKLFARWFMSMKDWLFALPGKIKTFVMKLPSKFKQAFTPEGPTGNRPSDPTPQSGQTARETGGLPDRAGPLSIGLQIDYEEIAKIRERREKYGLNGGS